MIELQDGMLLYHGSYIGIPEIDLNRCFGRLDFGRGFYLTSSYEQAYNYVQLSGFSSHSKYTTPPPISRCTCLRIVSTASIIFPPSGTGASLC